MKPLTAGGRAKIVDYHVVFDDWWQRDLDSMVRRDRNHPSIIMWSIGNEVMERDGRGGGVEIAQMLGDHIRRIDPTRSVTSAICSSWTGGSWEQTDPVFATLDIGGYNYEWRNYLSDHQRLPERIMLGTESFPIETFDNWMAVLENPFVIGDFVWTSLDYLGESGIGRVFFDDEQGPFLGSYPWHQANCGDLDLCGFKRAQSFYRDMLWVDEAQVYIAVHAPNPEEMTPKITRWGWPDVWANWNWPGHEGSKLQVDIYSNCEEVELFLDDRSVGIQPSNQKTRYLATFEVEYAPGELRAVGYHSGKPAADIRFRTAGKPAKICLIPDRIVLRHHLRTYPILRSRSVIRTVIFIRLPKIISFFSIQGPGEILAVGSSNPVSTERYIGSQRRYSAAARLWS